MTLMRTIQVNPAEEPFAMLSGINPKYPKSNSRLHQEKAKVILQRGYSQAFSGF